jgi:ABC-type Co2+ transport system permease subunit
MIRLTVVFLFCPLLLSLQTAGHAGQALAARKTNKEFVMKKTFLLLVLMVALLSSCSPQGFAQKVVELPQPIQLALLSLVTFLVGYIFARIAELVPWLAGFLGQYVDEVSTAVAGAVILALQNLLGAIPPQWEGVANAALMLVVAVLAAVGLLRTLRKARVPGFRK